MMRVRMILKLLVLVLMLLGPRVGGSADSGLNLQLSDEEQAWLVSHPEITLVAAKDYYPFEFFDEKGRYRGVAADYFELLAQRLGIRFNILASADSAERLAKVKAKHADMLVTASEKIKDVQDSVLFTRPHIIMSGVIVGKHKYNGLASLKGKKLAVISGSQWETLAASFDPEIKLIRESDMTSALEHVSLETVDALLSDIATTSYYIHREGMTNLNIVGGVDESLEIRIGIRQDWPILISIMDKALASISAKDKEKIRRQWIHIKKSSLLHSPIFWSAALAAMIIIATILASILVWNRTLKRRVQQRTKSLDVELRRRHEAELELQAANNDLLKSHRNLQKTQLHLIHAAKMESVGHLAAGIAHEVKNPLAIISLGLDYITPLIKDRTVDQDVLQDMIKAVSRADSVINGLLDFSREDTLNSSKANINRVIEDALQLVKHELAQSHGRVVKVLDKNVPTLTLDINKMLQVFVNLFLNSLQAMESGGTITVSSYQLKIQADSITQKVAKAQFEIGQTVVVVQVSDDGPGVDESKLSKIFDLFYTTKPVGEGTGLGLPIIKNIVDLHRGAIEVKNRPEGGLSISIILPTTKEPPLYEN